MLEAIRYEISKHPHDIQAYRDFFTILKDEENHKENKWLRNEIVKIMNEVDDQTRFYALYKDSLLYDSQENFDSYLLYIESNRLPEDRFYQPRRRVLKRSVDAMQRLIDGDLDELFVSQPPRTGKTTLLIFLMTWLIGRDPERSNLYSAYSDQITGSFYNGVLEVITDPYTYLWNDVFPSRKIVSTNAKEELLDVDRKKRYPSLTCRSLYGTLNGACDCNGLLVSDDLIGGIEEAINPFRMNSAWEKVDNNLLTRAKGQSRILWNGTRWSINDPTGRRIRLLQEDPSYRNKRYDIITLPALDENDRSNFDYDYGVGFSTQYYIERRSSFEHNEDYASWLAQYQQEPIERAGTLFTPENMRYYSGETPDADKIFMAVDPAFGGGDYVSGPVVKKVEEDLYIVDVIYDNSDKKITIPKLIEKVIKNNVTHIQFAVNKMTMSYKEEFERQIKEKGYKILITTKPDPNKSSKEERIFQAAPEIRDRMIFKSNRDNEYNRFMQNVFGFLIEGNNRHDDAPDSLAMAIDMDENPYGAYQIFKRFF